VFQGVSDRQASPIRVSSRLLCSQQDRLSLDGITYLLVTLVEGCIDVAQHIGSSQRYAAPDSNADALRALGARGVVSPMLAASLARAVGIRNVLVHPYATVDDAIVMNALERLDEFDGFVAAVGSWLRNA
jgi:uncharacterized protein YutE (UPF0331/DUF86 family)